MSKFTELARSLTRRGNFHKHTVADIHGVLKTWISTDADDVFITDVTPHGIINPDELIELLNQAPKLAEILEEVYTRADTLTAAEIRFMLSPFVDQGSREDQ